MAFKPIEPASLSDSPPITRTFNDEINAIERSREAPVHRELDLPLNDPEFLAQEVLYLFSCNESFGRDGELSSVIRSLRGSGTDWNYLRSPINSARVLKANLHLFVGEERVECERLIAYYEHLGLPARIDGERISADSKVDIDFVYDVKMKNAFSFKSRVDSLVLGRDDPGVLDTVDGERMVSTQIVMPGHAMMLNLIQARDGRYRIIFENTGFGAEARGEKEAVVSQEIGPLDTADIAKIPWMLLALQVESTDEVISEITKKLGGVSVTKGTSLRQMGGSCVAVYRRSEMKLVSFEVQLKAHQAILDDLIQRLEVIAPDHPMLDFAKLMRPSLEEDLLELHRYQAGMTPPSRRSSVSVSSPLDAEFRIDMSAVPIVRPPVAGGIIFRICNLFNAFKELVWG